MSEFLDNYLKALEEGTLDDFLGEAPTSKPSPVSAPSPSFPDDFDAVEEEEASPILGNVVGIGAELGTGLFLTKRLHRSQQFLKWANGVKKVSVGAVVTPEPSSTIAGLGTLALSEAAIWGASNFLGQKIRKAYGVQDNISGGEVLASAVFGVGLMTKAGQKVVSLGEGLAQMKAWGKGNELLLNGTKSFVSGASLGLAETALRQEVQLMLGERENRDAIEYLIGGAAGGGFNTMFDVFSRTGKWGQAKAKQVTAKAKEKLESQAEELEKRAAEANPRAARALRQDAKKIRTAIKVTDDLGQQIEAASESLNNPKVKEEPKAEPTPTPKTTKETPFKNWQESEAYAKEIGGLGINRSPRVDASLVNLTDDALKTQKRQAEKALDKLESGKMETRQELDEIAVAQDRLSEFENEEFRRRFKVNIDEYKAAASDEERAEIMDFIKSELFDDIGRSKDEDFKLAFLMDQLSQEGLFNDFMAANKRELQAKIDADPEFQASYEEVFEGDLLDQLNRGKALLEDASSVRLASKTPETPIKSQGAIDGPTINTPTIEAAAIDASIKATPSEPTPKTPEESPRTSLIDELSTSLDGLDRDTMSRDMPRIEREAKTLYRDIYDDIGVNIRKIEKGDDAEARSNLLALVKDLRYLNTEVKDVVETTAGRTLQAARRDAMKYSWTDKYSLRSQQEDAQLAILEDTLSRGGKDIEAPETPKMDNEKYRKKLEVDADDDEGIESILDELFEVAENPKTAKPKKTSKGKKEKKPLTDEQKAEKAKDQLVKKKEKLKKRLGDLQQRFGDDIAREEALETAASKPKKQKNPEIKDLEDRIKFYEGAEAEVEEILKLKRRLGELANIEGSGDITLQRQATAKRPSGPSKGSPEAAKIRKTIAETKARMKQRLKEIDDLPNKIAKEKAAKEYKEFRAQLLVDIENAFYKSLDADSASLFTKSFRWLAQSRQLALINQLPSALAGVPTGVISMGREVNRSLANYTSNKFAGNELAGELAKADLQESLANFKNLFSKDTAKAVKRTLKENQSATDPRKAGRMEEDLQQSLPRGEAALIARARRRAVNAAKAKDALVERAGQESPLERLNNIYFAGQSAGVRLIQGIDEGFKRTLVLGRIRAASRKEAIMELSEVKKSSGTSYTPKDVDELAKTKFENALIDSDGLMVLRANHDYLEEVDLVRRELLFAANSDNVAEVVAPISEKVVQGIKSVTGTDHPFSFLVNAIMPYIGVPIRGVFKGVDWMGAPIRIAGLGTGNVVMNPYVRKIKDAMVELENFEKLGKMRKDSPFDEKGIEAVNTIESGKAEILERIERLDARRIQYNADTLADAFTSLQLIGLMATAVWAGNATGSMTFLTDDQKKKLKLTGTQPFKLFGMDYKAIGPAAFPLAAAGDLTGYLKIRQLEAQTGETIIDEDMTWMDVILNSMVTMAADQPLSTGAKSITEILGNDEQRSVAASSMLAGYVPVPAQARKAVQQFLNDGRMADLKGSSFTDRLAYQSLGMGMSQYKTDYFGYDIEEPKSFTQLNIMRQWPDAKRLRTEFENILRSDVSAEIKDKPDSLQTGIRMKDFVDHRGITLNYRFDQVLKETKINGKTLVDAVNAKIRNSSWRRKYDKGAEMNDNGDRVNQGLLELNKLMKEYYDKTRQTIIKNKVLTSSFINKDNETLLDAIERFDKGEFFRSSGPINLGDLLDK